MPAEVAFWDTSAIIPLFCNQVTSIETRRVRQKFNELAIWWGTHVEVYSGVNRLLRERAISRDQSQASLAKWNMAYSISRIVQPEDKVLQLAIQLTCDRNIRALDAFQLAAALAWCREKPRNRPFVCADKRLGDAANDAGFKVVSLL
ncbi:MAG TPA: type II toxin-antitoxin system VapC family toxin [Pyrinomonadaceae bacterium]|nr:type II toxin-antitoxin system VapC family toxin [Pyrinomonadaceae bacterium]